MRYELEIPGNRLVFRETATGLLDILEQPEATKAASMPGGPELTQSFDFEEIGRQATIRISGTPGPSSLRQDHFAFLVRLAKNLSYLDAGVYHKVAGWLCLMQGKDPSHLNLLRFLIPVETRQNLFLEHALGSFHPSDEDIKVLAALLPEPPGDLHDLARDWYREARVFYTRVVGFGYRIERFRKRKNGEDFLSIRPGDDVFVVREPENSHDGNAVTFFHQNGEKLGYVRQNIARYLAPVMDAGALYSARVMATLGLYRDADELVHLRVERMG
ncbi:MAG: hypothetical protein K6360_08135 [Deltaproteobacteria bacterium]